MEQTRAQLEKESKPATGVTGDVSRLKSDATASVEELREFVAGLKGRSPQEVLGIVTGSSLFTGVFQATVLCIVVLAVATVGPWMLETADKDAAEAAAPVAEQAPDAATDSPETAAADTTVAAAANTGNGVVDPAGAATAMGIDEVKNADTATNPLDANLDNLLDKLD